jgi:hypothetical protein
MKLRPIGVACLLALALTGCSDHTGRDAAAKSAADRMERRAEGAELTRDYQQARVAQQWDLALSYADSLHRLAPDGALDDSVQSTLSDTRMRAEKARDRGHLATLWSYNIVSGGGSEIAWITASILSDSNNRDADEERARLVIRNHPQWGHSAAVVLDKDTFDCAHRCSVSVAFDDQPPRPFAASTFAGNPHSLNIEDEQSIRSSLDRIRVLAIGVVVNGKPRTLKFSVGGFDRVALERKLQ